MYTPIHYGKLIKSGRFDFLVNSDLLPTTKNDEYYLKFFKRKQILEKKDVKIVYGRGQTLFYKESGFDLVLRSYFRGGLISKIFRKAYLSLSKSSYRAFKEFELLCELKKKGLNVPTPLIAKTTYFFPYVYNDIVLLNLKNTKNLDQILQQQALTQRQLESLKYEIQKMFKINVIHTDFNIKNLLLDDNDTAFIIDFDKCYIKDVLTRDDQENMLSRLKRSFLKQIEIHKNNGDNFYYTIEDVDKFIAMLKNN